MRQILRESRQLTKHFLQRISQIIIALWCNSTQPGKTQSRNALTKQPKWKISTTLKAFQVMKNIDLPQSSKVIPKPVALLPLSNRSHRLSLSNGSLLSTRLPACFNKKRQLPIYPMVVLKSHKKWTRDPFCWQSHGSPGCAKKLVEPKSA